MAQLKSTLQLHKVSKNCSHFMIMRMIIKQSQEINNDHIAH